MRTDRVTTVNLRGWLCNKMSGCLPGEIPCGLKASRLSYNRLLLPQKGGDCYAIAEQAIELLLFKYIFVVHRSKHWWFVNNPPVSSTGQGSTVVSNDKNKKYHN